MLGADDDKPVGKSGQRKGKTEGGKTGQRNRKSAQKQNSKPDQLQDAQADAQAQVNEQLNEQASAPLTSSESFPTDSSSASTDQVGSVASTEQLQDAEAQANEQASAALASSVNYSTEGTHPDTNQVRLVASAEQLEDAEAQVKEQVSAPIIPSESHRTDSTHSNTRQPDSVAAAETVPVSLQSLAKAYEDYTRKSFEQTRFLFENLVGVRSLDKAVEVQADFVTRACEAFVSDSQKIRDLHRSLARQRLAYLEGLWRGWPQSR